MSSLTMVELDVVGQQDNWVSFPNASWTNPLDVPVSIKIMDIGFAGADSLLGEMASWALVPASGGISFPGISQPVSVVFSHGEEVYTPPNRALRDRICFGMDEITLPAGSTLYFATNAGPVNLPGGPSPAFTYTSTLKFWYHI